MIKRQSLPKGYLVVYNTIKKHTLDGGISPASLRAELKDMSTKDVKYITRILRDIGVVRSIDDLNMDMRKRFYKSTDPRDVVENEEDYHPTLWELIKKMIL